MPSPLSSLLRAVVLLTLLLAPSPAEAATLRLWHAYREGGKEQEALREILESFQKAHPGVTVETLAVPFEGYASKLGAAIPAGNGPDLFIDAHERVGDYHRRGLVTAVGAALPESERGDFARAALDAVTLDGTLYGVPLARKCLALYLNDALVPQNPPDLEALLEAPLPAGVLPLAHVAGSAYMHAPFLAAFGGAMLGPDGTYGLDSDAGRASVAYVAALTKRGVIPEEASGSLVSELFSSGKAAAAVGGPWTAGDLKGTIRYRVVPLPPIRGVGLMRPLLTVEAVFVTPQAGAEGRALARHLGSGEAAQLRARVGKTVSARSTPAAAEMSDPFLLAFARAADGAVPMPTSPLMRLTFEPADRALRKVLRGDASAEVALREAAHRFDDVRRPPPEPASPTPFLVALGLLTLAGAGYLLKEASQPGMKAEIRKSLPAYGYIAQALLSVSVLVIGPLVVGAGTSFFAGRGDTLRFVGLAHYGAILTARGGPLLASGSFYLVLLVTILWTIANVALHLLLGLFFGLLLSHPTLRFKALYRVLLIVPWAVPSYVTALAWKGMFHRQFGAINAILQALGAEPVAWFSRFATAFTANLATNVWLGFPFMMVVTLGAITSVPQDVLEAAEVDGATRWQRLRLVTLPMIRPVLIPAVALGAVWTFNMFNVVFLVSGGDPDGTTDILVSEAYRWAFTRDAQMGYAAAYAVLIFLLLFGGTRALNRLTGARI
jgi:arabinogalactan oligomer/maltooligosaccharide transport system permease protein